jgi:type I restriction enzyme S subunit
MTHLGTLRPGWQRVKFGDVVRQVKDKVDPETSGLERYIAGEHMDTDDLRIRRWGTIDDGYLGPAFHMRFRPGQVLYGSRRTYLRKVAVPDFEGICANTTFVLESANPTVLLPELLPFVMQTEAFNEHSIKQSKGSVNPYVNFSDLAWYEFALPPLEEQRRIAEVLWAVEEQSISLQHLVSQTESLRRSTLFDSFSQLDKDTTVKWVRVYEAGEVLMGRQLSPKYQKGISPRPYLRVANVFDGYIDISDVKEMDFSDVEYEQYRLISGDVLLVEGHSSADVVGRSAIFRDEVENCCMQNTLLRFRSQKVLPDFSHQYFRYCLYSGQFSKVAKQTTIAHLGSTRFGRMRFPVIEMERQREVLGPLAAIESSLKITQQRLDQTQKMKNILLKSELLDR